MSKIYIICPVRNVTEEETACMQKYVAELEAKGHNVHFPPRDVDQSDTHGISIVLAHVNAMVDCAEVHIYFSEDSVGSLFDLGMAVMLYEYNLEIDFKLINPEACPATRGKSFNNVIRYMCDL